MTQDMKTALSEKMRALAASQPPDVAERLRTLADSFDAATAAHYAADGDGTTAKKMLGAWARARRAYCEISGEPLA